MDTESGAPDADVAVAQVCMVFMAVMEWLAGGRSASAIQVWILLQVLDYIHNDEHNRIRHNDEAAQRAVQRTFFYAG